MLCWIVVGFSQKMHGQVLAQDSLVLIDILRNNCHGCALEDSTSPKYWDTLVPINSWPGVILRNGRIVSLNFSQLGLEGRLNFQNELDSLNRLVLEGNQVVEIVGVENSNVLQSIEIANCPIKALPEPSHFPSLRSLILSHLPELKAIPSLKECNELKTIVYTGGTFNGIFDLAHCPDNIENIGLVDCVLDSITEFSPQQAENLRNIGLMNCHLKSIPTFAGCDSLSGIYLTANHLTDLPDLSHLTVLKEFVVSGNDIKKLPPMHLEKLERFEVRDNPLTEIPDLSLLPDSTQQVIDLRGTHLNFGQLEPYLLDSFNILFDVKRRFVRFHASDSALFLLGSPVSFDVENIGGTLGKYQWYKDGDLLLSDTLAQFYPDPGIKKADYQCVISHPLFPGSDSLPLLTVPVSTHFEDGVHCDDPNGDSTSNILDIIGVGIHYNVRGTPRPDGDILSPNHPLPAYDWKDSNGVAMVILYNGDSINLKHFDSNGDGTLDQDDLDCFKERRKPVNWAKTGLHENLYGTYAISLKAETDSKLIEANLGDTISITYQLQVDSIHSLQDTVSIKGLIFVRPEVQNKGFKIVSMKARFAQSEFALDSVNILGLDSFYKNTPMNPEMFNNESCLDEVVNPLEVALFRKDKPAKLWEGQRLIDCVVIGTIDDLTPYKNDSSRTVPLIFETTNIVLFEEQPNGNWRPHKGKCQADTIRLMACKTSNPSMELRGAYRTNDIFVDYAVSGTGGLFLKAFNKRGVLLDTIKVIDRGETRGTFRYPASSLPKGRYKLELQACDGSSCVGEFARRGGFWRMLYYWFRHRQPSCLIGSSVNSHSEIDSVDNCLAKMEAFGVRAAFRSQFIYFDYEASEAGPIKIVIKNKKGSVANTFDVSGPKGSYRYDMRGLKNGKYTVTATACDGSQFVGEFARRGFISKPYYYILFQPEPYLADNKSRTKS